MTNSFEIPYYIQKINDVFGRKKEQKDGVYYTEEDYQELQRNLILYKDGDQEAITYIVKMFHPFLLKYTYFIKCGNIPYTKTVNNKTGKEFLKVSPTISRFVSLYIDKSATQGMKRKKVFSDTCIRIKKLFGKYDFCDIYNELVLALLNMANKYKITKEGDQFHKKNGTFHMYVSKCFHWEAFRFLNKLIKDPLDHNVTLSLKEQFDEIDEDSNNEFVLYSVDDFNKEFDEVIEDVDRNYRIKNARSNHKVILKEKKNISSYDNECLNFNWTSGVTCNEVFAILTSYEREIIYLSFIEKKTDIEIGDIYGLHRATINRHKKMAIDKIKDYVKKYHIQV